MAELQTRLVATGVVFVTVSVIGGLVIAPFVAETSVVPATSPEARPVLVPIVATEVVAEVHVTLVVMICTLASEYVPVAMNCWVVPAKIVGLPGVTTMDTSAGAATVSVICVLETVPTAFDTTTVYTAPLSAAVTAGSV